MSASSCVRWLLGSVLLLSTSSLAGERVAAASPEQPPVIAEVAVQHSVAVDRLDVEYVDITARITSVDGVTSDGGPYDTISLRYPYVEIEAAPGSARRWFSGAPGWWPMDRISGDPHDGIWRARVPFTSTAVGSWHVKAVVAADTTWSVTRQPVTDGAIAVQSSDRPYLVWTTNPAVQGINDISRVTYSGRLLWTDGGGVGGATLRWDQDSGCVENDGVLGTQRTIRTDSSGRWSFSADEHNGIVCLGYYAPAPDASSGGIGAYKIARYGVTGLRTALQYAVSTPVDAATAVGQAVAVNGKIHPYFSYFGGRVLLQRYTARQWKTVGSAPVRTSGRYTLTAQPPYAGRHAYRVWKPSDQCIEGHCLERGAVSATFAVTAG